MAVPNYRDHFSTRTEVDAHQPLKGREQEMTPNSNNAFVFKTNNWQQFERFLVLGSEGGSYYIGEQKLTKDNAQAALRCINADGVRAVNLIVQISDSGRAMKNDPALFALAMASASEDLATRRAALEALPRVARIGTHLFHFAHFVEGFRGWGKALKRAVGNWYVEKSANSLAYQAIKYQQRDGWSHRDLLRLSHPKTEDQILNATLGWIVGGMSKLTEEQRMIVPDQIAAFETVKVSNDVSEVVAMIQSYNLPREAIPTQFLNDTRIWEALLVKMPMTALIRNLGTLSKLGMLERGSEHELKVLNQLTDEKHLKDSRIHPIKVLEALKTYSKGSGVRGSSSWPVNQKVVNALDEAFYKTFSNVEPTGKSHMLAVDVSGSMASAACMGSVVLTAREAAAAMALVTANVEENTEVFGFNHKLTRLNIKPSQRLDDVCRVMSHWDGGSTDCAAPMIWARENKKSFDAFFVYTDNETGSGSYWGGSRRSEHPSKALKEYRQKTGINAKMGVIATSVNNFSIADPSDAGMIDVAGFDPTVPQVLAEFVRG